MIKLRGITWDHTRGYLPMAATAQRFSELHPEIAIGWEKRSLKDFGELAPGQMAEEFDLLVLDHPFIGTAAAHEMLLPLEEHLPPSFLAEQAAHSVGQSHASYAFAGSQFALAIDAAAPIAGWRTELLERAGSSVPSTWAEVLTLARRGLVAIPGTAIDMLMHFSMMCVTLGEPPLAQPGEFASREVCVEALRMLREIAGLVFPDCAERNPIGIWEWMAGGDGAAYCPFAYGYSNYSREGYAAHRIEVGGLPSLDGGVRFRSTLGGAGLAISARTRHRDIALDYCRYAAGPDCQRHVYFDAGGQPGHRSAWTDAEVNRRCGGFFEKTLRTLDEAWLRPRWNGYHQFQDRAAAVVHAYVWNGGSADDVVRSLNQIAHACAERRSAHEAA